MSEKRIKPDYVKAIGKELADKLPKWAHKIEITELDSGHQLISSKELEEILPVFEMDSFNKFMYAQTVIAHPDGSLGVYPCDFYRWLYGGRKTQQDSLSWD